MLQSASIFPGLAVTAVLNVRCSHLHAYLLHVVVECDAHAFFTAEHLTGHERVEDSRAGQWEAEIEAEQPPVFHILVELEKERGPVTKNASTVLPIQNYTLHGSTDL